MDGQIIHAITDVVMVVVCAFCAYRIGCARGRVAAELEYEVNGGRPSILPGVPTWRELAEMNDQTARLEARNAATAAAHATGWQKLYEKERARGG